MAYDGWMKFGGSEIINADRTAAYIAALTPQLGFKNCSECSDLRYLVNRKPHPIPGGPEEILFGPPSNFETTGQDGWNEYPSIASGVVMTSSTVRAFQGTRSLLTTWPTAQPEDVGAQMFDPGKFGYDTSLEPGRSYTMTAKVWVPTGHPAVRFAFLQEGVLYWGPASTTTNAWTTVSTTFTAVNSILFGVLSPATATTAGQQVWIDDVHVVAENSVEPQNGEYIEETTRYRSPILDAPEWYDPNDEDTWGFAGLYPLRIRGLENDTRSATVTEAAHDGGFISLPRKATREITVEGLMVANSEPSLSAGMRWLRKALDGSGCGGSGLCEGDDLCFYTACPEDIPLEGYNYGGPPMIETVPGAYGWQAFGGTYTPDTGTGIGTYTSNNAGVAYAEYSPFKTVCDQMKFTVNFAPEDLSALTSRTNMATNPSFRASSGAVAVRTNLATNPCGKYNHNYWYGIGTADVSYSSGSTSSPNYGGGIGLQSSYLRADAVGSPSRAGKGLGTTVTGVHPGVPLLVSPLLKTIIAGVTKIQIRVKYLDEDGDVISGGTFTSSEQTIAVGPWTRFNYISTPPAGSVYANCEFIIGSSVSGTFWDNARMLYASELLVEEASAVPNWDSAPYFDGSIGYTYTGLTRQWTGTVHNSQSVLTGPSLPNTLVGNHYWTSSSDWVNANSYRSGTAESIVFVMGTAGSGSTNSALVSPSMPVLAGKNFYAARIKVQHLDGPQASLGVVLRLRAYDAAGTSLGYVATAGNTAFPLSVGGTVNVTAPSTLSLPVGTTNLRAEVWLNTGAAVVPTILKVSEFLVEPVAALSTQPGAFFDGETADVPGGVQYSWTGTANYTTSVGADPITLLPPDVSLVAWAAGEDDPSTIDTFIGKVDGYTKNGSISLTVDGGDWATVAWRLIPNTTTPVLIQSVTYEWHEYIGYTDVFAVHDAMHPLGYYTVDPPATPSNIPDPVVQMLDTITGRYFRSLRRVTAVSGPTVIEEYSAHSAHMCRVEFTLMAGVPFIYGDEVSAGFIDLSLSAQSTHTYDDDSFVISEVIPDCVSLTTSTPVVDPACATVPAPPQVPDIMAICGNASSPVIRRYGFRISGDYIPQWGDVVPIIQFTPDAPIAQLTVKFYPTPVPNTRPMDIDPCAMCAGFVINYADTNGIVIDGANEKVYSPVDEITTGPGGAMVATGRVIERAARHLVSNLDYGPMEWPVLSCGIGYLVVVETFADINGLMTIDLVARQ